MRALSALALAGSLLACENWDALVCARRLAADAGACPGGAVDGGAFSDGGAVSDAGFLPQVDFPLTGGAALVRLVVGDSSQVLAFGDQVVTVDALGSPSSFPFDAGALDVLGSPARFWVGSPSGQVWSWLEGTAPQAADLRLVLPHPVDAVVALREGEASTAAAFIGPSGAGLTATRVNDRGGVVATSELPCALSGLHGATVSAITRPLVAGVSSGCDPGDAGVGVARYGVTQWLPSFSFVELSEEPAPTRLRMSGRENNATIAFEVDGGINLAWLDGVTAPVRGRSVALAAREVLEDVGAFGDEAAFVYALTNRAASALEVTPAEVGGKPMLLAAGASLLVFGRWENGLTPQVTRLQVLSPARPFSSLRFALDRNGAAMWLAVVCPAGANTGAYCPTPQAQVTLLRYLPPP